MRFFAFIVLAGIATTLCAAEPGIFAQPDAKRHPNLFVWTDTCNVYVLRDGDTAILIDLGDGSVLDHLKEIGVNKVEWVLFTHHHREQCQGAGRLKGTATKIGGPAAERALFENPTSFRRMKVRLSDPYTIHGSSYVRPPIQPIKLDRAFKKMDVFQWKGHEIWCHDTRGNSPGATSYCLKQGDGWIIFSGDLMVDGAKMQCWYDSEWDYGFGKGLYATVNSAGLIQGFAPKWLLPSHGPPIGNAVKQLEQYQKKLRHLESKLLRGYSIFKFSHATQNKVAKPSKVPHIWQVTPHLYKFRGPDLGVNFNLILADSGHALLVDCGLMSSKLLDEKLKLIEERLGLKKIDALIATHMHGDHFLQTAHLKKTRGVPLWGLDRMAPMCERPEDFDYAAPIQAYGGIERVNFDRLFKSGETFKWEGYTFTIDWMPGQTEFALAMHGQIDGRKMVFTGDNIFADPDDPTHTGNECVVAHNSQILEEGYIYAGEYLAKLKPDMIVGSHCFVMDKPGALIERYRKWGYQMRDAFVAVSSEKDYRNWFDPFWVRAEPYRLRLKAGQKRSVQLHIRNFHKRVQKHRIEIHTPPGLTAPSPIIEGQLKSEERVPFKFELVAGATAKPGVYIVAFDTTIDGRRYGERFDMIIEVE
jgi:glyoxylase-like metal-dependent hydrolase (beta-lactamase superfamily II)